MYRTKLEIARAGTDRVRAAGVRFGCVLADAGHRLGAPFRQGLGERGPTWAVGVRRKQKPYPVDVGMIFPVAGRGRPRQRHVPDQISVAAETVLAARPWRRVGWRRGTKGRSAARFAAGRVRVAEGPTQRIHDLGAQHLPGEEAWLLGGHRSTGEKAHHLTNLPADASLKQLAAAVKARWPCGQAHRQLTEELGLDHFEGRSWTGLHQHALMCMGAYAFLQSRRLAQAGREQREPPDRRRSPACRSSGTPSSPPWADRRQRAARTVDGYSAPLRPDLPKQC